MKIGVPKEIKSQENRIGLTPESVKILTSNGNDVMVENNGGLAGIEAKNREKAQLLYDAIDSNPFYYCPTAEDSRSDMNVVFRVTGDREDLEARFVKEATAAGLSGLKGHRSVGGLRASIYNAHPRAGVEALVNFMSDFAKQHEAELTSQAVS